MVKRGYRLGSSRLRLGRGTHCAEAGRQAALLEQTVGWVEPSTRRQPSASMGMCHCRLLGPTVPPLTRKVGMTCRLKRVATCSHRASGVDPGPQ